MENAYLFDEDGSQVSPLLSRYPPHGVYYDICLLHRCTVPYVLMALKYLCVMRQTVPSMSAAELFVLFIVSF